MAYRHVALLGFDIVASVLCRQSALCDLIYNRRTKRSQRPAGSWVNQYRPIGVHATKTARTERSGGAQPKNKPGFAKRQRMSRQDELKTRDLDDDLAQGTEHFVAHHLPVIQKHAITKQWKLTFRHQEQRAESGKDEYLLWSGMPLDFLRKTIFRVSHVSITDVRSLVEDAMERKFRRFEVP